MGLIFFHLSDLSFLFSLRDRANSGVQGEVGAIASCGTLVDFLFLFGVSSSFSPVSHHLYVLSLGPLLSCCLQT